MNIEKGFKINRLTFIKFDSNNPQKSFWKCDCDVIKSIWTHTVIKEITKSCGCLRNEVTVKRSVKHNLWGTRIYGIWKGMKRRTSSNPHYKDYKNYYGRGIRLCKEWKNLHNFVEWSLQNGYSDVLSIDRINNDGNYEPSNCRWATIKQQANNRRTNIYVLLNGVKYTLSELSILTGIKYITIISRYNKGWTIDKIIKK